MLCDRCPRVYHIECLHVDSVPEGEFVCGRCDLPHEPVQELDDHVDHDSDTEDSGSGVDSSDAPIEDFIDDSEVCAIVRPCILGQ